MNFFHFNESSIISSGFVISSIVYLLELAFSIALGIRTVYQSFNARSILGHILISLYIFFTELSAHFSNSSSECNITYQAFFCCSVASVTLNPSQLSSIAFCSFKYSLMIELILSLSITKVSHNQI
jgi:hypothetical protein